MGNHLNNNQINDEVHNKLIKGLTEYVEFQMSFRGHVSLDILLDEYVLILEERYKVLFGECH